MQENYPDEFKADIFKTSQEAAAYLERNGLHEISQRLIHRNGFGLAVEDLMIRGILTPDVEQPILIYSVDLEFCKGFLRESAADNPEQARLTV